MIITISRKGMFIFYLVVLLIDLFFIAVLLYDVQNPQPQLATIPQFWFSKVDLKKEGNLATWYSSILLFVAGGVALLNLCVNPFTKTLKWIYLTGWSLIGCLLLTLSADESAVIHESIASIAFLERSPATRQEITLGAGDWLPFLLPFIIGSVLGLLSFLAFSFFRCKKFMLLGLAGVLCWVGAIVGEAIEGRYIKIAMSRQMEGLIEESLEIIGTTLLMIAFAEHYRWRQERMNFNVQTILPEPSGLEDEKSEIIG